MPLLVEVIDHDIRRVKVEHSAEDNNVLFKTRLT